MDRYGSVSAEPFLLVTPLALVDNRRCRRPHAFEAHASLLRTESKKFTTVYNGPFDLRDTSAVRSCVAMT
jgi:hypothetical protein